MRWLFVVPISDLHAGLDRLRSERQFRHADRLARDAGFFGRHADPGVFSAVFLLFPLRLQAIATTIAGILAVLAPTVGPIVGGWITETYSWHWLFLINVAPGILSAVARRAFAADGRRSRSSEARSLDVAFARSAWRSRWRPGDRPEGSAQPRLAFLRFALLAFRWPARAIGFAGVRSAASQPVVNFRRFAIASSRSAAC